VIDQVKESCFCKHVNFATFF